jgi:hypothetical protein
LAKPGSSLDELALSQVVGINAASKLADYTKVTGDEAYTEFAKQLWHEQIWCAALKILCGNREPFMQLAGQLQKHGSVKGATLRKILAQVKKVAL